MPILTSKEEITDYEILSTGRLVTHPDLYGNGVTDWEKMIWVAKARVPGIETEVDVCGTHISDANVRWYSLRCWQMLCGTFDVFKEITDPIMEYQLRIKIYATNGGIDYPYRSWQSVSLPQWDAWQRFTPFDCFIVNAHNFLTYEEEKMYGEHFFGPYHAKEAWLIEMEYRHTRKVPYFEGIKYWKGDR